MFEREPVVGTMSVQVARILGMRIVGGEYRPGDLLPVEADLCAAIGVSRTTEQVAPPGGSSSTASRPSSLAASAIVGRTRARTAASTSS